MHKRLAVFVAALAVAATAQAQTGRGISFDRSGGGSGPAAAPETGFPSGAEWTHTGPGADFRQVSWTTRTAGIGSPPVTCPFKIDVPAPPPGAVVVDTIISWTYLSNDNPATDPITVNGTPLMGAMLGWGTPDLCWGRTYGVTYMVSGVTGIVNIGGSNQIDDVCDGAVGSDPAALGEGITIIVIYEDPASSTTQTVDVFAGYTSTQSNGGGPATALLELTCTYNGGPFHMFVNADDGQQAGDTFLINGVDVSGLVAGTYAAGDAWVGLAGPSPLNNLYDAAEDDIQTWVTAGDTSVLLESYTGGDCVAHSLAACSYEPDGNCAGCSIIPFCNPFTGSFSNTATITPTTCDLSSAIVVTMDNGPVGQAAYLNLGNGSGLINNPKGADGDLCVAGGSLFSRYAKDLGVIDSTGSMSTDISNSITGGPGYGIPLHGGNIMPGETWYFQYWIRTPAGPTGFSEAVCITFE